VAPRAAIDETRREAGLDERTRSCSEIATVEDEIGWMLESPVDRAPWLHAHILSEYPCGHLDRFTISFSRLAWHVHERNKRLSYAIYPAAGRISTIALHGGDVQDPLLQSYCDRDLNAVLRVASVVSFAT
jgi:hypothetical protein